MGKKKRNKRERTPPKAPHRRMELHLDELRAILERTRSGPLSAEDHGRLAAAVDTLAYLTQELEGKETSLARLRKLLFGSQSEKTRDVLKARDDLPEEPAGEPASKPMDKGGPQEDASAQSGDGQKPAKKPGKGHGRNGASAYVGATIKPIAHPSLEHGGPCPHCAGKVYRQLEPEKLVRVMGVAPLAASVYELDRLRCNRCGDVYTAPPPPGVGQEKYDATAVIMIGLLKYGCGLPFYRIEKLCQNLGIPMPSSTQAELIAKAADGLEPVWRELVHRAAQGQVLHIDDTKARILALNSWLQGELAAGRTHRSGIFTSGVLAKVEGRQLALFFTGLKHAGENLAEILAQRSAELPLPIQMGDASSRNTKGDFEALVASCLTHARRYFVDVIKSFPEEVRHVLEQLRIVYKNDAEARPLSPQERLRWHQEHSGPVMKDLAAWLQEQFDTRKVEPNSSLGKAIKYMQNHWGKLTLFLREPGAPIDNNICERTLKRAIVHRKNALFYKTEPGAHDGDVFMSLIHTAELCKANAFEYLVALLRHRKIVKEEPGRWLPWNFEDALAELPPSAVPDG